MPTTEERRNTNPSVTRCPRILCVDDDPDIQSTIELRMQRYEADIERAFYGMQGIAMAVHDCPDLILLDLAMPHGDGTYFLECVRKNLKTMNTPIIVLTGMRDSKVKSQILQAGADVFLQKPVHFDELFHHFSRFLVLRQRDEP